MSLEQISWLAGALSLLVATATFIVALIDRARQARREEVIRWQRVIVYSILQERPMSFSDIKLRYLAAAQQATDVDIPRQDIQDGALKLVLLTLMEGGEVGLCDDGTYRIHFVPRLGMNVMEEAGEMNARMMAWQTRLLPRMFDMIEGQPGVYTMDALYREFRDRIPDLDIDMFQLIVRAAIFRGELFKGADSRLFPGQQGRNMAPSAANPPAQAA